MKLGLQTRLLASLLAILLVVFVMLGIVLLADADNRIKELRETEARHQAKSLAAGSLDGLVSHDYELLERLVNSSMPSADYAYATLVRTDGQVMSHTNHALIGEYISTIEYTLEPVTRKIHYQGRPVLEVVYPALIDKSILANAHVAYFLDTESIFLRHTIWHIIMVLAVSLVLLVVSSYLITRSITNPIGKLKQAVKAISLSKVVEISPDITLRADEVGELARSFQTMSEELVESHTELVEILQENKAIVDTATDGIIVIDNDGIVISANSATKQIFGYEPDEIIGNNVAMLMPEPYRSEHDMYLKNFQSTGEKKIIGNRLEVQGLRKDGGKFPIELAVEEINLGKEFRFAGTVRDISDRYEYEQSLLFAKDAAIQGSRVKSEFMANISHELRTPMNGIIGPLGILQAETELSDNLRDMLNMASNSANVLMDLINNVLDFSSLDSDIFKLDVINFSLKETMDSIRELYSSKIADMAVKFNYEYDEKIPPYVNGDPVRIRSVVNHLLGNAIKFTSEGEISLNVSLAYTNSKLANIEIEVSDTGIGIDNKDQSRIFELFTQADGSTTRKYGGTGIGLAIIKKITQSMGGTIELKSAPGQGSCFTVRLNLMVSDEKDQKLA